MKQAQIGWRFWSEWVILMAVLISLSYTGIDNVEKPVVTRLVSNPWAREAWIVAGIALLACLVGIGQRLLLRPYTEKDGQWGFAIAATYLVGGSLTEIASFTGIGLTQSFAASFLLLGPVCGILQWLILRPKVDRAGWWVLTQTVSWLLLFAVTTFAAYGAASILGGTMGDYLPVSYGLGGAALGALTGAVLVWLLREPAAKPKKGTASAL